MEEGLESRGLGGGARTLRERLLQHPNLGQPAKALRRVEAVPHEKLATGLEADEIGLELGAPLAGLVEQGADRDVTGATLLQEVLGEAQRKGRLQDVVDQQDLAIAHIVDD